MRARAQARIAAVAAALLAVGARAEEPPRVDPPEIAELSSLARAARSGLYPRFLRGEQVYWTALGVPEDEAEALFDEDGRLEVGAGRFSLEPFVALDGALVTAADARVAQELLDGWLPIPSVRWERGDVALRVRAFAAGAPGAARVYASYRVENRGAAPARGALVVALRPLQVLPPWQTLNMEPALARVSALAFDGRRLRADAAPAVLAATPPDGFAAASEAGAGFAALLARAAPAGPAAFADPRGLAAGALRFGFELAPGAAREIHLRVPLGPGADAEPAPADAAAAAREVEEALAATAAAWRAAFAHFALALPPAAADFELTLKSSLAWILIHRDGPRLQPGSRNYARSWIRDGALTANGLVAFGFSREAGDYLRWYAPHQFADGKVPCCIDARGPDPTPEHDSDGELLHALATHFRFTGDRALAAELWPHALRAVAHLDALRAQRSGDAWRTPERLPYFGLLPESISHEGYARRAVHSYWDQLFALRGLRDAAFLAHALGDARAPAIAAAEADFQRDLVASYAAAMALHDIDYLPGAVELGDFDPTATAIALTTGLEPRDLPAPALRRTLDRYGEELARRRAAGLDREAWTPYELRIADAWVRMGERERAAELLALVLADRRPLAWNAWPEILWREPRRPAWLGDMPHGWAAAEYARAVRSALVWERESDAALVVAAGVPADWLADGGRVRARLPTWYGELELELWREPDGALRARLAGTAAPPGGIVLVPPLAAPLRAAEVNGASAPFAPDRLVLRALPADLTLRD
jgi:hypothetical protein